MLDIHVIFFEAARIEQHVDALARGQLALGMLCLDPLGAAAQMRLLAPGCQFFQYGLHRILLC